jgi:hypothetical protein
VSEKPRANLAEVALDWLKGLGVLTLTFLGLILYICLAAPTTIFYTRLGTTPGKVGITYTSLLSGSLLGIIAMIAALAVVFAICSGVVWHADAAACAFTPATRSPSRSCGASCAAWPSTSGTGTARCGRIRLSSASWWGR